MVGLKLTDPFKITTEMLTNYAREQLDRPKGNKTAEAIAQVLAGIRVSRYYRVDIPEPGRNLMAREFLKGVLTDGPV